MQSLISFQHIASLYNGMSPWVIVVCGTLSSALALFLITRILSARLRSVTDKSRYTVDSVLVRALSLPMVVLSLLIVIVICYRLLRLTEIISPDSLDPSWFSVQILSVLAVLIFTEQFIGGLICVYSDRSTTIRTSSSILRMITRGMIISIGLLILLGTMGVSITPLVASLGISSLAVALALQPTLENIFSGIQLVIDKPIRVGDFIELESGEQGTVEKIGWRSTWIKMMQNNTVIMPNSELSKSKIINYFYPEKELSVPVDVGVHYTSDLEHVERVTLEVAREILVSHKWGVDDYETFVIYTDFDDSSINFTVMLRAKEYFNRFWVKSAFIKALHQRYNQEGIVIPFPIRAINTDQESAKIPKPVEYT